MMSRSRQQGAKDRLRLELREDRNLFSNMIAAANNSGNGNAVGFQTEQRRAVPRHASRKKIAARVSPGAVGLRMDNWKSGS